MQLCLNDPAETGHRRFDLQMGIRSMTTSVHVFTLLPYPMITTQLAHVITKHQN